RADAKRIIKPQSHEHLPIAAANTHETKGRPSHAGRAVDQADGPLLHPISEKERLQAGLGVHRKPRLTQPQVQDYLASLDFQVVRYIPNTAPEQQHRQRVKGAVRKNLRQRVIQEHTVPGETASNHHVVTLGRTIKEVADLRQKMLEVAIYREHITTGRHAQTIGHRPPNAIWR